MKTHTSNTLIDNTRGLKFTESPRWHDGKLWFVDIHDKRTKTADLDGHVETAVELPFVPNAFGFQRDGSLLVGDAIQRQIHRWDGKALEPLADLSGITTFCLSDGIVDAQDRMYVGDIGYDFFDPTLKPVDTCLRECGEIVERVEFDTQCYAVMLGGPDRRSLFICGSDSHDPAEIARSATATLRVVEIEVPGAGLP
jgi:sugar lactone lactonase YvrE